MYQGSHPMRPHCNVLGRPFWITQRYVTRCKLRKTIAQAAHWTLLFRNLRNKSPMAQWGEAPCDDWYWAGCGAWNTHSVVRYRAQSCNLGVTVSAGHCWRLVASTPNIDTSAKSYSLSHRPLLMETVLFVWMLDSHQPRNFFVVPCSMLAVGSQQNHTVSKRLLYI